jgi:membrane-bound lytic murein transglycosylase D
MQLLMNNSKYLILVALSFVFLLVFYGANTNVTSLGSIENYNNSGILISNALSLEHNVVPTVKSGTQAAAPVKTIWSGIRSELSLNHYVQSAEVKNEIRKLLADRKKLFEILESSGPYIYFIHKKTHENKLPAELALIPAIESEFNPRDHSNKGATGLWQLMPGTAHDLGLEVKSNYDGRRNVVDSTNAALSYFSDLNKYYKGNWSLAIAAYNSGQGKVDTAIRRAGSRNFWNLKLPHETKIYLPKLLAVAEIIKNPEKYRIQLPQINNEPYFEQVKLKKSVNLSHISKSTGISMDSLHNLNPDFKNAVVSKKNSYTLLVPVEYSHSIKTLYSNNIKSI